MLVGINCGNGAQGRNRTGTVLLPRDFKSVLLLLTINDLMFVFRRNLSLNGLYDSIAYGVFGVQYSVSFNVIATEG